MQSHMASDALYSSEMTCSGELYRLTFNLLTSDLIKRSGLSAAHTEKLRAGETGRLNVGGDDAFCVIGNVVGEAERCCHEVRFETRRCVKMRLRPELSPGPRWDSLQVAFPFPRIGCLAGPPSWIWGGE